MVQLSAANTDHESHNAQRTGGWTDRQIGELRPSPEPLISSGGCKSLHTMRSASDPVLIRPHQSCKREAGELCPQIPLIQLPLHKL